MLCFPLWSKFLRRRHIYTLTYYIMLYTRYTRDYGIEYRLLYFTMSIYRRIK